MTDEELLSGALKRARWEKLNGINSDETRLADALREAVEALRFILDECDWEEDKRISDACRKILAKYQEVDNG